MFRTRVLAKQSEQDTINTSVCYITLKGCFCNWVLGIKGILNSLRWFARVAIKQYLPSAQLPNLLDFKLLWVPPQFFMAKCFKVASFWTIIVLQNKIVVTTEYKAQIEQKVDTIRYLPRQHCQMFSMRYHTIFGTPQNLVMLRVSWQVTLKLSRRARLYS